jgi:hypothetical protein
VPGAARDSSIIGPTVAVGDLIANPDVLGPGTAALVGRLRVPLGTLEGVAAYEAVWRGLRGEANAVPAAGTARLCFVALQWCKSTVGASFVQPTTLPLPSTSCSCCCASSCCCCACWYRPGSPLGYTWTRPSCSWPPQAPLLPLW